MVTAVADVAVMVALTPPTVTVAPVSFVPWIVIDVPPDVGPEDGEMLEIVGPVKAAKFITCPLK